MRLSLTKQYSGLFSTKTEKTGIPATMYYTKSKGFMVYDTANNPLLPKFFKNTGAMKKAGFYFAFITPAKIEKAEAVAA